ncbi:malonate decarboxylase holo-ACP synthase [Paenibacillus hexagrammi]|uniref:Malonate decarboxylase holo-ACP synthase n=1 Tax=Paenibacillus hexagrammi TaxID=2908839 RepID=A0ABY3SCP2_9BACL|nr:malonate decarboxylase holo-ACP synthase [Paenibacillus sp. YPD9-1]UJF31774.1 malonate decarboxylase holo-ACP synthase [Paenibacillus sp. YPD9-1]
MEVNAHDLLRISSVGSLIVDNPIPDWVCDSLSHASLVVVRRDAAKPEWVPVGIRGHSRRQRFPAFLPMEAIIEKVKPEDMVEKRLWMANPRRSQIPALTSLDRLAEFYSAYGLSWGPTGSVGFELASGVPTAHGGSDLDVVIRAPQRVEQRIAKELIEFHESFPIRIDVQIETPLGAVSLVEYARGTGTVLVKMNLGPRLVQDPWINA